MDLIRMTRDDGAVADVRPDWVEEWTGNGWSIAGAMPSTGAPVDIGTDSGEQFSDEQLRAIIEQETGSAPHHRMGRAKLIETFNALNAKAAGE